MSLLLRHILLAVLPAVVVCLPLPVSAQFPIEQAQREYQARYYYKTGRYVTWPGCPCNKLPPPHFPADGFYGDEIEDPYFAAELVDDLANMVFVDPESALRDFVDPEVDQWTDDYIPRVPPPADMRPVTADNYPEQLAELLDYLQRLTHLKAPAGWIGVGAPPDPEKLLTRAIATIGPLPEGADCSRMREVLLDHYAANPGDPGGRYPLSVAGVFLYDLNGRPWVEKGYAVVTARLYADLSAYGRYPGSAACYVRALPEGEGFGTSQPPGGGPPGAWRELDVESGPVPGEVFTSNPIPGSEGDPPVLDETCQSRLQGWSLRGVAVVIEPEFETQAELSLTCAELCCSKCKDGACDVGKADVSLGSVRVRVSLGAGPRGQEGGFLYLAADAPHRGLASRAALQTVAAGVEVMRDAEGLRQVHALRGLADIQTISTNGFEIRFYHPHDVGPVSNGLYTVTGDAQPFSTIGLSVSDDDPAGVQLLIRETFQGKLSEYLYAPDPTDDGTRLTSGTGTEQRTESVSTDWTIPDVERIETHAVRGADQQLLQKQALTYTMFPWGEEITREVTDPDGQAWTTTYAYYDDPVADGTNYGRLRQRVDPGGHWQRYAYDGQGRQVHTVTRFLDAPLDAPPDQCRETRVTYGNFAGLPLVTRSEWLLGQEVARTHRRYAPAQDTTVRCRDPGAAPDSPNALVTITTKYASGLLDGKPTRVEHPDGTLSLYTYQLPGAGLRTIRLTGAPSANGQNVVEGTRTDVTANETGAVLLSETRDLPSNRILSRRETVETDLFGRALRTRFLDGSSESTSYACCGIATQQDRDGVLTAFRYDSLGRVVETTRNGIATGTEYDAMGRIRRTWRRGADQTVLTQQETDYNLAGDVTAVRDGLGHPTTFASRYEGAHRIDTTTFPDGGTEIREYYGDGALFQVLGTAVPPVRYQYGVTNILHDGQSTRVTFTRTVALNDAGNPSGMSTTEYQDMLGRTILTEQADGAAARSFYNHQGRLVRTVSASGLTTLYAYTPAGQARDSAIDVNRNGIIDYDGIDQVARVVNSAVFARGTDVVLTRHYQWTSLHDSNSMVEVAREEVAVNGSASWQTQFSLTTQQTERFLEGGGRQSVLTTPDGVQTTRRWADGRLVEVASTNSVGQQLSRLTYTYDPHGRLAAVTEAATGTTTYTYDALDRTVTETRPPPGPGKDPPAVTNVYDQMGRIIERHGPAGVVTNQYNLAGNLLQQSGAHTYPVAYSYDTQRRLDTMTTWRDVDSDQGRAVTTWHYDPLRGFPDAREYDDGAQVTYTREPDGRIASRQWARGAQTDYAYDGAARLTTVDYHDNTPDIAYTYDRRGRVVSVTDTLGTRVFGYDDAGMMTNETFASGPLAGYQIQRTYDALLRPGQVALLQPGGTSIHRVGYTYDSASRMATVSDGSNTFHYGYLPNTGLLATTTCHNGAADILQTTRQYNTLLQLVACTTRRLPDQTTLSRYAYTYDRAGQRSRAEESDGSFWEYAYDPLGQLASARRRWSDNTPILGHAYAYAYDSIGNRTASTANNQTTTYDATSLNQYATRVHPGAIDFTGTASTGTIVTVNNLPAARQDDYFHHQSLFNVPTGDVYATIHTVAVKPAAGPDQKDIVAESAGRRFIPQSPEPFTYDPDGNLLSDGRWIYSWTSENRLATMETRHDLLSDVPRQRIEFTYDYQGRRTSKKVFALTGPEPTSSLQKHLFFIYDGCNLLAELDALNAFAPIRSYSWGLDLSHSPQGAGGIGGLLSITLHSTPEPLTLYPLYNGRGDITHAFNPLTSTPAATFAYSPFGQLTRQSGPHAKDIPLRFSTKYHDPETDLTYFGYRYLNPTTGRWLNRDPAGEAQGPSLYHFVANNPVTTLDPLGLALYAFDGTGTGYDTWTHVSILHRSYQGRAFYADGVGSRWYSKVMGGAFGLGGRSRIDTMYDNLVSAYKAGDTEIDIIGFSRGAALAREFANEIYNRGVVETTYEKRYSYGMLGTYTTVAKPKVLDCDPQIRFVGLFDTVGSFGIPGNDINMRIRMNLPPNVQHAAQAIAQDERRDQFPLTPLNRAGAGQRFSQYVFPGDHSDIGGGHTADQNLLALAPLFYMHSSGIAAGVPFGPLGLNQQGDGLYLTAGGFRRPWPYNWNSEPHDLTKRLLYTDGGIRANLPRSH